MSNRTSKRVERIRAEVPISALLHDLGYRVHADSGGRKQQYACDLHGDGSDSKPSARVYPDNNSTYCFACGRYRDPIQLVREKVGKSFHQTLSYLEDKYGLPALPWSADEEVQEIDLSDRVRTILSGSESDTSDLLSRAERVLRRVTSHGCDARVLVLWEELDRIGHLLKEGVLGESAARASAVVLLEDAMAEERGEP